MNNNNSLKKKKKNQAEILKVYNEPINQLYRDAYKEGFGKLERKILSLIPVIRNGVKNYRTKFNKIKQISCMRHKLIDFEFAATELKVAVDCLLGKNLK